MTHDHDQAGFRGSTAHNGHRPHLSGVRTIETKPGLDPRGEGHSSSGSWNDDSARNADDALMRCYNG